MTPDTTLDKIITTQPLAYAWFHAVCAEDCAALAALCAQGVPVDTLHPLRHTTALMEATRRGCTSLVQWLLEQGAAPDLLCGDPASTALHCALRRQEWDIAVMLAERMTTCASLNIYGTTPLHMLASEGPEAIDPRQMELLASLFIAKECPLDAVDGDGTTALHLCAINDQLGLARLLLHYGANPDPRIRDSGVTPLIIAALEKNLEMAKLLIHYGADLHACTLDGATPLSLFPTLEAQGTKPRNRDIAL